MTYTLGAINARITALMISVATGSRSDIDDARWLLLEDINTALTNREAATFAKCISAARQVAASSVRLSNPEQFKTGYRHGAEAVEARIRSTTEEATR